MKEITVAEARHTLGDILEASGHPIAAGEVRGGLSTYVTITSPIWGGDASVGILERIPAAGSVSYKVQVSWSSMGRSVASAHAAVQTYEEAVDLAALLEATIQGFPTIVDEDE